MKIEIIVGAPDFRERLEEDLSGAESNAYIQTFSFEGDRVGTSLARSLERCGATDRRLLVDGYSLLYHSDRLIPGPAWLDRSFRREVLLTHRWVERLREGGTGVRFSNPIGPWPDRLVRRNHKKIVLVDDRVVYLGGINFSDHNFEWHDMMIRIEDPRLGALVADDFRASWNGRSRTADITVEPIRLISLNGRNNARAARPILEAIASAERSIDVISAYLSHPFTERLGAARRRGARVRVLTPERNNKPNLARHILYTAARHGFDVFHVPGMSHLKAMVVDDERLIAGSSNFDFMSYHILEELVVMTKSPEVVAEFRARVWNPDFARATRAEPRVTLSTGYADRMVRLGATVAGLLAL